LALAVSAPVDSLPPEDALVPDQPPEAVQEVAFVEDQVSVDDPPLVTDVGFPASDTVGTGGDTVVALAAIDWPEAFPAASKAWTV
jgi:hypothetical protein